MRFFAPSLFAGGLAITGCAEPAPTDPQSGLADAGADHAATAATHRYRITLENLTSGQVFSPGVAATHTKKASVWSVNTTASEGIRLIAEDGLEATAVAELTGAPGIFDVVDIASPTNRIGATPPCPIRKHSRSPREPMPTGSRSPSCSFAPMTASPGSVA